MPFEREFLFGLIVRSEGSLPARPEILNQVAHLVASEFWPRQSFFVNGTVRNGEGGR